MVYSAVLTARMVMGAGLLSTQVHNQKSSAAMLTYNQSLGVAPEVNLRNSTQARKHANKKSILSLKPTANVTRSKKQGYQWPYKKDLCPPKI